MTIYYPVLRVSPAEMNAYETLKESTKHQIIPVLEAKRISRDSKETWWNTYNTLGSYLKGKLNDNLFIYDFKQSFDKLGEVDEHLVDENRMNVIKHCSRKLDESEMKFIPCVHFDSPQWYIQSVINLQKSKLAIRVRCKDFNATMDQIVLQTIYNNVIDNLQQPTQLILILDFANKPTSPERIQKAIEMFSKLEHAQLVLSLTTCPEDASNVGAMSFDVAAEREDYRIFRGLAEKYPNLAFSDYTVRPTGEPDKEARIDYYNTYIKVFYTTHNSYMIGKSTLIKDNGIDTFHEVCQEIIDSDVYQGSDFSAGSYAIKQCADRIVVVSNHSKPIEYGINHHIELTASQLRQN
ncbi:hypothetical protein PAESOLCIP111_06051 [Paenibacillus solanacearum]|uniref:Beta protein n=1 Tax=Paenibacillus solanacearum TaxID=2048548 RepID=A0A916K9V3_9BACL|nr:beta family protein [Paenibacillus solanacearum]CAG7650320.1 hypothetical protein PAESOLCIP111_06051 [Paenibacillus solanacearum]